MFIVIITVFKKLVSCYLGGRNPKIRFLLDIYFLFKIIINLFRVGEHFVPYMAIFFYRYRTRKEKICSLSGLLYQIISKFKKKTRKEN